MIKQILSILCCCLLLRADKYVRDGGTSSACTSWSDACDQLTTAEGVVGRDEIIWVADGTYTGATLNVANSGTSLITVKKATIASHGTETGWDNAYGDGQAEFTSGFVFGSDYWVIDGVHRNTSNWSQKGGYGFAARSFTANDDQTTGICAHDVTIRYVDIGGPDVGNTYQAGLPTPIYIIRWADLADGCQNWLVEYNRLHNAVVHMHLNGVIQWTIQYNQIEYGWGKEAIRGQLQYKNIVARYNVFKDSCQFNPDDATSACTAEIASWGSSGSELWDNNEVYGNVFLKTTSEINTGGNVVLGGNGGSWVGDPANNCKVYNNTFAGYETGTAGVTINGGTGNEARNNLAYDIDATWGVSPNTSSNGEETTNPFVDYGGGNFHLSTAIAGTSLSSPYNVDLDGVTRGADGTFDRGAYEYQAGGGGGTSPLPIGGGARIGGGAKTSP